MPPVAVSIGEPAGIGMDVLLLALRQASDGLIAPLPAMVLFADRHALSARQQLLGIAVDLPPIEELDARFTATPGMPGPEDGHGVIELIDRAVAAVRNGTARAVVTLPINKKSLYDVGFRHPGHTEYLGALAADWPGSEDRAVPVMMLAGPDLRTIPVTIHIPLKDVPDALTSEAIIETGRIAARDLRERFGIAKPRLAVSGLNPHAGEDGAIGSEDETVIAPAVAALVADGIDAVGPLPADTMFHTRARAQYDVALCMYHDQALIPAKALAFDESVNVTLGLPFVRTSPDHGTAFDIAGTGKANPASFIAALRMADAMTR